MVLTKLDLDAAFATQQTVIKAQLDEGISSIRNEIITTLTQENNKLKAKIESLEDKYNTLQTNFEINLQYQRNANIVIDGIPGSIDHDNLENIVVTLFNRVCLHNITERDLVACHRISKKSTSVLVKFVNSKDATALLDSRQTINSLNNDEIGLGHCGKFFVGEHLTPYMAGLAYRCRCLKRSNKIEKTKIQKGIVKILMNTEGSFNWSNITNITDICKLIPDYNVDI